MWNRASVRRLILAGALFIALKAAIALGAQGAPDASMMHPIQHWIDAFNSGRGPLPEDIFTNDVVITGDFPPFVWSGKASEHQWAWALDRFIKPGNQHMHVGAAQSFQVGKDRVTFVLPATLTLTAARTGRTITEDGLWLFVLVRNGNGWLIAADTWTKRGG